MFPPHHVPRFNMLGVEPMAFILRMLLPLRGLVRKISWIMVESSILRVRLVFSLKVGVCTVAMRSALISLAIRKRLPAASAGIMAGCGSTGEYGGTPGLLAMATRKCEGPWGDT